MNTPVPAGKPFTWSYSKLKNYESCPKRHWHLDIQKDVKEEESESLKWGNEVHKALANRLSKGKALPVGMTQYEPWCERVLAGAERGGAQILVEQKLAITRDFGPCGYFDKPVWYRGVCDALKIVGPVGLAIDWKTGKILDDAVQLALMACCIFAHFPAVQKLRTEFVWLKEGDNVSSREDFSRTDMASIWRSVWPRIQMLESAFNSMSYPPKPGALCRRWCPVTQCPHHGE